MSSISIQVCSNSQQTIDSLVDSDSIGDGADESGVMFSYTDRTKSLGAFGAEFWVSILISVPIGVATGIVANSIFNRLAKKKVEPSTSIIIVMCDTEVDLSSSNAIEIIELLLTKLLK